jgi:hypothetical protein
MMITTLTMWLIASKNSEMIEMKCNKFSPIGEALVR